MGYRYKLERGSKKFLCPSCGKKRFVRYVDTVTGEYLPEEYGRCDREGNCAHHSNPYLNGYGKDTYKQVVNNSIKPQSQVHFDYETFNQTLQHYKKNRFIQNLQNNVPYPFTSYEINQLIKLYKIGTTKNGSTTFPYIDIHNNIRAVQVKEFDHRNKTKGKWGNRWAHFELTKEYKRNNQPLPQWLESYNNQEKKQSCLFGEHLLRSNPKAVLLVEAPKTALYCWLYLRHIKAFKDCAWLATGSLGNLTIDRVKVLKGKTVLLVPDLSLQGTAYSKWEKKAKDFQAQLPNTKLIVSKFLENFALKNFANDSIRDGGDIADFIIQHDWRAYRQFDDYTFEERIQIGMRFMDKEKMKLLCEHIFEHKAGLTYNEIVSYLQKDDYMTDMEDITHLIEIMLRLEIINTTDAIFYNMS